MTKAKILSTRELDDLRKEIEEEVLRDGTKSNLKLLANKKGVSFNIIASLANKIKHINNAKVFANKYKSEIKICEPNIEANIKEEKPVPVVPAVEEEVVEKNPIKRNKVTSDMISIVLELYSENPKIDRKELASICGCSTSTISRIINGRFNSDGTRNGAKVLYHSKRWDETKIKELKTNFESCNYPSYKALGKSLGFSDAAVHSKIKELYDEKEIEDIMKRAKSKNNHQKSMMRDIFQKAIETEAITKSKEKEKEVIESNPDLEYLFGIKTSELVVPTSENNKYFPCVLVADRHDINISTSIFESALSEDLMFDYEQQESIVRDFLYEHEIKKNNKGLMVYVTGKQSALACVIKVCFDDEIDLILKHFNTDTKKYHTQIIRGEKVKKTKSDELFEKLTKSGKKMYLYNCKEEDLEPGTDLYGITLNKFNDKTATITYNAGIILCTNQTDMWKMYSRAIEQVNSPDIINNYYCGVFAANCMITPENMFVWGSNISKGYNFK